MSDDTAKWATPFSKDFTPGKGWEAYTDEEFAAYVERNGLPIGGDTMWTKRTFALSDAVTVYYEGITTEQVAEVCRMDWREAYAGLRALAEWGVVFLKTTDADGWTSDFIDDEDDAAMSDDTRKAVLWLEPEDPWPEDADDDWQGKIDAARRMGLDDLAERFAAEFRKGSDDPSEGDEDLEFDDDCG